MKLSSTLMLLGAATTALAAPSSLRRQSSDTNVLENGSFESGATGWILNNGARVVSNSDTNDWRFTAPSGTHFGYASIVSHHLICNMALAALVTLICQSTNLISAS